MLLVLIRGEVTSRKFQTCTHMYYRKNKKNKKNISMEKLLFYKIESNAKLKYSI